MGTDAVQGLVLKPVEERLIRCVAAGETLDLVGDGALDEQAMGQWGESQTVRAEVIRDLLRGKLVDDPDPLGVMLRGARIAGVLDVEHLTSQIPLELSACYLPEGLEGSFSSLPALGLSECRAEQGVRLDGAHIGGDLEASGATLTNDSGPALTAEGIQVDRSLFLRRGFTANGTGARGAVRLVGARIGGQLSASGATLTNDSGPALTADTLRITQSLDLGGGFTATGASERGAVRLTGAHIGGQLSATGATLTNDSGPALTADTLRITQSLFIRGGFTATGNSKRGAVRLIGARIGGQLSAASANLTNDSGPALTADGLQVEQSLFLRRGFTATGAGERGAVRLVGAHIGGQLSATGATLTNDSGPALIADRLLVDQNLRLTDGFTATGCGDLGAVRLPGSRINGGMHVDPAAIKDPDGRPGRLELDGLVYSGLPGLGSVETWLRVLVDQTTEYAAQPYRQLAAAAQAAGHDSDARKILIAQRRDQLRRRAISGRSERAWSRITGIILGYGYQPWRALLGLLGVVAIAVALTLTLGAHGGLAHTNRATPTTAAGSPCTTIERIGVGLDLSLPLIKTGARDTCNVTATTAGDVLVISGWALQLMAWALATLFIAGFTGAVRKT
jgi:hypothetical protein